MKQSSLVLHDDITWIKIVGVGFLGELSKFHLRPQNFFTTVGQSLTK